MINIISLEETIKLLFETRDQYIEIVTDILKTSKSNTEIEKKLEDGNYSFSLELYNVSENFTFSDMWDHVYSIGTNQLTDLVKAVYRSNGISFIYNKILFHLDEYGFITLIYSGRNSYNEKRLYELFNGTLPLNIRYWTNEHLTYLRMMED